MTIQTTLKDSQYWLVKETNSYNQKVLAGPFEDERKAEEFKSFLVEEETYSFSPYYCADDDEQPSPRIEDCTTNPYGIISWSVGSDDDFICFDWAGLIHEHYALHSVCNSETDNFIQDYDYRLVHKSTAVKAATEMVQNARSWCAENGVRRVADNGLDFIAQVAISAYELEDKRITLEQAHRWAKNRYGAGNYKLVLVYEYRYTKPIALKIGIQIKGALSNVLAPAQNDSGRSERRISQFNQVDPEKHSTDYQVISDRCLEIQRIVASR
jgi:hypothetical protein